MTQREVHWTRAWETWTVVPDQLVCSMYHFPLGLPTYDVKRTTGFGRKGSQNLGHHEATESVLQGLRYHWSH